MKHANAAIFVPHAGCPNRCSFCDQKAITAQEKLPHAADVERVCMQVLSELPDTTEAEIAFFGGSFTAVPEAYQTELLTAAQPFLGKGKFRGIRISTRPDYIDAGILQRLAGYGVTAIELGAQSMSDTVLAANERGHTAEAVRQASRLIRENGFSLGLQIMPGLYKSSIADERHTLEEVLLIRPDTLRIYPVVILKGTLLGELFLSGAYQPFSFEEMIALTAEMLLACQKNGICVIKCGLHASRSVEENCLGGSYHPAFRELCESRMFRSQMAEALGAEKPVRCTFAVHPSCISRAVGQKRANLQFFREQGIAVRIAGNAEIPPFQCKLAEKEMDVCI